MKQEPYIRTWSTIVDTSLHCSCAKPFYLAIFFGTHCVKGNSSFGVKQCTTLTHQHLHEASTFIHSYAKIIRGYIIALFSC